MPLESPESFLLQPGNSVQFFIYSFQCQLRSLSHPIIHNFLYIPPAKGFFPQFQSPWEGVEGSAPVQGVLSHPFFPRNSPLWDIFSSSTDPDEIGAAIPALELQFLSLNLQGFLRELRILGIVGLQRKKIKD